MSRAGLQSLMSGQDYVGWMSVMAGAIQGRCWGASELTRGKCPADGRSAKRMGR